MPSEKGKEKKTTNFSKFSLKANENVLMNMEHGTRTSNWTMNKRNDPIFMKKKILNFVGAKYSRHIGIGDDKLNLINLK